MVLDALENLLDINFQPDINISNVNLINYEGGKKLQRDGRTLELNIGELNESEREELQEIVLQEHDTEKRVLRDTEEDETRAIEAGFSEKETDVLDYFDGVVSDRYHKIIQKSLYLKALISQENLGKDEIYRRKNDIARKYGSDGIYLSSLTTAGYFHEDGGLRDLYWELGVAEGYDRYDFQSQLEHLVDKKLLCVFVEMDDTVTEATNDVRGRLTRYQKEDPFHEWLDIRGIGGSCEAIIDGVIENLEDEFIGIDYDRWEQDDGQTVVRIYPRSIGPIND